MDVRYINPFLSAVQNIFETMINVTYTLGKPTLKKVNIATYEISGIIGITREVSGCIVVSFPESVALQLASALLGDELTQVNDNCKDAIGEIANMVASDAKKHFPAGNTSISVPPSVIFGKHEISHPRGVPIISIHCKTDAGGFAVEVALKIQ